MESNSFQQQTQFIVQTSPGQGTSLNQSPNQRMQKTPGGAPANWFLQQQQQQQPSQQQGLVQNTDATQVNYCDFEPKRLISWTILISTIYFAM